MSIFQGLHPGATSCPVGTSGSSPSPVPLSTLKSHPLPNPVPTHPSLGRAPRPRPRRSVPVTGQALTPTPVSSTRPPSTLLQPTTLSHSQACLSPEQAGHVYASNKPGFQRARTPLRVKPSCDLQGGLPCPCPAPVATLPPLQSCLPLPFRPLCPERPSLCSPLSHKILVRAQ